MAIRDLIERIVARRPASDKGGRVEIPTDHQHIFALNGGCWCGTRLTREQFLERQLTLDTEKLWQAHLSTINTFLEIAKRKLSVLDDYGNKR